MASLGRVDLRQALRQSPIYRPYLKVKYRLSSGAREELFAGFYRDNVWGDAESRSGNGSSLAATAGLVEALPSLLRDLGVTSLLDVPCGDFVWMQTVDLAGIDYTGADLVGEMVAELQAAHGRDGRRFVRLDVIEDSLPPVDAVLMRDLLLHLTHAQGRRALANVKRSGARWLLTSQYPTVTANPEIEMGQHRFPNLTLPPYNLPAPARLIEETPMPGEPAKVLAVWPTSDL